MNERIKELAEQTGWSEDIRYAPRAKEIEKFAELIVRECISALDEADGSIHHRECLFEHFGVSK